MVPWSGNSFLLEPLFSPVESKISLASQTYTPLYVLQNLKLLKLPTITFYLNQCSIKLHFKSIFHPTIKVLTTPYPTTIYPLLQSTTSKAVHLIPHTPHPTTNPNLPLLLLFAYSTLLNLLPLNPRDLPRIGFRSLSLPELSIPLIRPQRPIPPAETGGKVIDKGLVVEIVVVGASPEGNEFVEGPREVVAAVGVDGLEESTRVRECDLKDGEQ